MSCKYKNNNIWCNAIQCYCQFQNDNYDGPKCPIYNAFNVPEQISSVNSITLADVLDPNATCVFKTEILNLKID